MSTYYEYQDVKVMIAHRLMAMDGWKVYGYSADNSDPMTDYYDPAHWGGVAEKNGYILCVDVYGASEPEEIRKYNYSDYDYVMDNATREKIAKLERMTVDRGASQQEEETAKATIEKLMEKVNQNQGKKEQYTVVGVIPGHMANPPRMNWHIEKDGIYVAKGNGILKFASIDQYYRYGGKYMEDMQAFRKDKNKWADEWVRDMVWRGYYDTEGKAREAVTSRIESMEKDAKMMDKFNEFINKLDTTCGGLLGEGNGTIYEKVTVTEYKKENKVFEDTDGKIRDGQCFILKSNFTHGAYKGLVYRIHSSEYKGQTSYHAYKLNGKLTKECTGQASSNNYWFIGLENDERFMKWIQKGSIAWCHIEQVKTPYEVEKVVKKTIKATNTENNTKDNTKEENNKTDNTDVNNYTYEVTEDTDTRDGSKIYLVRVAEKLDREEYLKVNKYIKSIGGYYSRYKKAFLFRENPADKLNVSIKETEETKEEKQTETEPTQENTTEQKKESVNYIITEDTHTKTGQKIWVAKPEKELSKGIFAEERQKLATMQGFYSSFKHGFIFKYDPTEKLKAS